jgi:hypothetical protein
MRRAVSVLLASQPPQSLRLPASRSVVYLDSTRRALSTNQNKGGGGFGGFRSDFSNRNLGGNREKPWDPREQNNNIAHKMADSDPKGGTRSHTAANASTAPPVAKQNVDEHKLRMDMALGKDRAGAVPFNRADSARTPDL